MLCCPAISLLYPACHVYFEQINKHFACYSDKVPTNSEMKRLLMRVMMRHLCSDVVQRLMAAMATNAKLALTSLNLSANTIEEKGFNAYL